MSDEWDLAATHARLSGEVDDLSRQCAELRKRSAELQDRCRKLHNSVEDVHRRAVALRTASLLARGDHNYILKKCGGCGLRYEVDEWFNLPFAGYQNSEMMSGEMRHCTCNSTLLFVTRKGVVE